MATLLKKSKVKPLPKHIEKYVSKNTALNMFGLINLDSLRDITRTRLSNEELIKRINNTFSHQMVNNKIEYKYKK